MSEKLCPDCGHPVAEHKEDGGCLHWQYYKEGSSERVVCSCKRTPADLQPEKQCQHTWSWSEGQTNEVCSKCGEVGEKVVEPPASPQMPLIETTREQYKNSIAYRCGQIDQRDADMAWPLCQAKRIPMCRCGHNEDEHSMITGCMGKNCSCEESPSGVRIQYHDQQVAAQAVKETVSICNQLIELVEHGDYSNGNVSQGTDEGAFMAMRRLTELKAELAHLRAMAEKEG